MSKKQTRVRPRKRKLGVQGLEKRRLLAADFGLEFAPAHEAARPEVAAFLSAAPGSGEAAFDFFQMADVSEMGGFAAMAEFPGTAEFGFGNDMLGGGFWMDNASTINMGAFGDGMNFEVMDVFPGGDFEMIEFEVLGEGDLSVGGMGDFDGLPWEGPSMASPFEAAQNDLELFDADGDALATSDEISSYYSAAFGLRQSAADGAASGLLAELDSNEDGALGLSELVVSYNRELAQEELSGLDADGDGLATGQEIAASYVDMFGLRQAAADGAAAGMIESIDTNDDGAIDLDELTATYPTEAPTESGEATPSDDEGIVDEDGSNAASQLAAEELAALLDREDIVIANELDSNEFIFEAHDFVMTGGDSVLVEMMSEEDFAVLMESGDVEIIDMTTLNEVTIEGDDDVVTDGESGVAEAMSEEDFAALVESGDFEIFQATDLNGVILEGGDDVVTDGEFGIAEAMSDEDFAALMESGDIEVIDLTELKEVTLEGDADLPTDGASGTAEALTAEEFATLMASDYIVMVDDFDVTESTLDVFAFGEDDLDRILEVEFLKLVNSMSGLTLNDWVKAAPADSGIDSFFADLGDSSDDEDDWFLTASLEDHVLFGRLS